MSLKEVDQLLKAASLNHSCVQFGADADGWYITKDGDEEDDLYDSTFEEVVERLRKWATPVSITVNIPYEAATLAAKQVLSARNAAFPVLELIREALKPYEVQP